MSAAQSEAPGGETQAIQSPQPSNGQLTSPNPTTQRQKNPKRVAAGKAVAEKTRLAREAQKKAAAEAAVIIGKSKSKKAEEKAATANATPSSGQEAAGAALKATNSISFSTILTVGGLVVGAASVYYQREAIKARFKSLAPEKKESAPSPPVSSEPASEMPQRKRGIRRME